MVCSDWFYSILAAFKGHSRECIRCAGNMGFLTYLTTLLWIGRIVDTRGFPLELTQFQSGDDVTLVCTATNTTIKIEFTQWYMDDVRVLMSVSAGNVCLKHPPTSTGDTYAYRYDLYISTDVSVSCGYLQHNMTLTTTQYLHAGTVWRCEDQRKRVSNNLTSDILGTAYESTPPLTASATTIATDRAIHGSCAPTN
ncbi:uncharacterized protein LOC125381481 [Haliotis rufescens]|uniref:uncharacterized protein LOC125381481 n=1 Tax=Haliotis rufescens TaxID=6454 RepID=UPI00201F91AF|nr:uncharacterized protein LOC125381481 [Haliotis rufescens]